MSARLVPIPREDRDALHALLWHLEGSEEPALVKGVLSGFAIIMAYDAAVPTVEERLTAIFAYHLARMWPDRHDPYTRKCIRDNLRGQRQTRENARKGALTTC